MTARPASPRRPRSGEKMTEMAQNTLTAAPGATKARKPSTEPSVHFSLPEKRFMAMVVSYARLLGWRTYHTHDSRRSTAGFPDLVMTRRPRVLFVELKSDRGRLSADQQVWLDDLRACGQEAFVWKPADWNEIEATLSPPPAPQRAAAHEQGEAGTG
jgi:hypothetical protein